MSKSINRSKRKQRTMHKKTRMRRKTRMRKKHSLKRRTMRRHTGMRKKHNRQRKTMQRKSMRRKVGGSCWRRQNPSAVSVVPCAPREADSLGQKPVWETMFYNQRAVEGPGRLSYKRYWEGEFLKLQGRYREINSEDIYGALIDSIGSEMEHSASEQTIYKLSGIPDSQIPNTKQAAEL